MIEVARRDSLLTGSLATSLNVRHVGVRRSWRRLHVPRIGGRSANGPGSITIASRMSDVSKLIGYLARKGFVAELPASALSQLRGRACGVNSVRRTRTLAYITKSLRSFKRRGPSLIAIRRPADPRLSRTWLPLSHCIMNAWHACSMKRLAAFVRINCLMIARLQSADHYWSQGAERAEFSFG